MMAPNEPVEWRLDVAQAQWSRDQLDIEMLPQLATNALVEGLDSPSMRQLAGLEGPDYWTALPLFERMMQELGRRKLDGRRALKLLVLNEMRRMLAGLSEPAVVANDIGRVWLAESDASDEWDELHPFYDLAEAWAERRAPWVNHTEEQIEEEIREEARRVCGYYERDLGL
jgi:hypothetical protein